MDLTHEKIKEVLLTVEDPELGINIVDLGLVYEININGKEVHIIMTLTTPACPLAGEIVNDVQEKVKKLGALDVQVHFVFEPPWSPEKMSERAKLALGIL